MNIKVDWSQPSTWRGAVMLASGVIVGGLTLLGYTEQATQANNLLNTIIGLSPARWLVLVLLAS